MSVLENVHQGNHASFLLAPCRVSDDTVSRDVYIASQRFCQCCALVLYASHARGRRCRISALSRKGYIDMLDWDSLLDSTDVALGR